jgi:hypothetical protein
MLDDINEINPPADDKAFKSITLAIERNAPTEARMLEVSVAFNTSSF